MHAYHLPIKSRGRPGRSKRETVPRLARTMNESQSQNFVVAVKARLYPKIPSREGE
jgi:hypothetical protein